MDLTGVVIDPRNLFNVSSEKSNTMADYATLRPTNLISKGIPRHATYDSAKDKDQTKPE